MGRKAEGRFEFPVRESGVQSSHFSKFRCVKTCRVAAIVRQRGAQLKPHQRCLFDSLTAPLREGSGVGADPGFIALLDRWVSQDAGDLDALYRDTLDPICRAIDVSRRIPVEFVAANGGTGSGEQRVGSIAATLAALLLAHASSQNAERGGRLKCVNTALKLIDLTPQLAERGRLLAWAHECVERLLVERPSI
jgi:hypothetical protein